MKIVSLPALVRVASHGDAGLCVYDSFIDGKRLVTAVLRLSEGDPLAARLAKQTRLAALAHQRSFGGRPGSLLVQAFDGESLTARVVAVLGAARLGSLVMLFGRDAAECAQLVEALGVRHQTRTDALDALTH